MSEHMTIEGVTLELSDEFGAMIVYTNPNMRGEVISVETDAGLGSKEPRFGASVVERIVNGRKTFAAIVTVVQSEPDSLKTAQNCNFGTRAD